MKLTKQYLRDKGFSSWFNTNPQDYPTSLTYEKDGLQIYQVRENVEDFCTEDVDGEIITVETIEELEYLMRLKTNTNEGNTI